MILRFTLPESPTHRHRRYTLVPVAGELVHAFLTVQQGELGPRGGTSRLDVSSYFVQEVEPEPCFARLGREFLLVKDVPGNGLSPFVFDREDESAEPYSVWVGTAAGGGACTCRAFRCGFICKHLDALAHACRVAGWRNPNVRRSDPAAVAAPV